MKNWRQCELRSGDTVLVSWVPEEHAHAGSRFEHKDEPGVVWEVTEVYDIASQAEVTEMRRRVQEGWNNNV